MEYLKVKNWSKFQHYKSRNPPWIKLYRDITSDYGFNALSDVDKCHLMLIWCEAASHDGEVPNDAPYLRRRLSLKSNPNLNLFINNGWLIESASISKTECAIPEKRREEQIREEEKQPVDNSTDSTAKTKAIAAMARVLSRSKTVYPTS